jgi:hypothetical protein
MTKLVKSIMIGSIIIVPLLVLIFWIIGIKNQEVGLRNLFTAKHSERTTTYDKIWKTIAQKGKIAVKNDSSFQRVVQIQMTGHQDGENVTWKWIQQSNPTATYGEVSILYRDLSRAVEATREEFNEQEKVLQDIKLQHDNLRSKFPSSLVVGGKSELPYRPITSDRTDDVIKTGKDNNVEVF